MAKLLFVFKRARPDIDLTISFLCSRVDKSTVEDWNKLRRLLHYINGTLEMKRYLSMNNNMELSTWVDASYGVHSDMKGHTDGVLSLGKGILNHKTTKHRINTKKSTESEIVGASDFLAHTVWLKRFLAEQGYQLRRNIYYQDNISAVRLESNGYGSRGEKSRHINIRYFFIKDILKNEKIELQHCPTERMIADYFTKPLQGSLFKQLRDQIMGKTKIPIEERVGNQIETKTGIRREAIGTKSQVEQNNMMTYAEIVKNGNDALKIKEMNLNQTIKDMTKNKDLVKGKN